MARGRRRNVVGTRDLHVKISDPLMQQIDAKLQNPLTGKIPYSAYQQLITNLFRAWLASIVIPPPSDTKGD